MGTMTRLLLGCAGCALMHPAAAEALRCGSVLIEPGDDALYVLEKCGEPASNITVMQSAAVSGASNVYQIGIPQSQRWLISRNRGQFRAVVTIGADGRVEDIRFERRRD